MALYRPRSQPGVVTASERVYRWLLKGYPPAFTRRFGAEMAQVFRAACQDRHQSAGWTGVLRLWLPTLWDWAWSAGHEHLISWFGRFGMTELNRFDRQLGDVVWMMTTGLYAGYSLGQVIEALAQEMPEPAAGAFARLHADLSRGLSLDEACSNLLQTLPSAHLAEVVKVIQAQRQSGGNLADLLTPVGESILAQAGSDPAMYAAMRIQAQALGATAPERARAQPGAGKTSA